MAAFSFNFIDTEMVITSRKNESVKFFCSLKDAKGRKEAGGYLVEGEKQVFEAVSCGAGVKKIMGLPELVKRYDESRVEIIEITEEISSYVSDSVTPQGIFAFVAFPGKKNIEGDVVLLDGVSDPGNVGTIIRTAAAVGVKNVCVLNGVDPYCPKCVRSSMGGLNSVYACRVTFEEALSLMKSRKSYVADMDGKSVFGKRKDKDFCLVIGNEAHGVSDELKSRCDEVLSLPMKDSMESLNAGVSCSIILYELLQDLI